MSKKDRKPRIDVMLSSTSKDLPVHREQATNGILRLRHLGMYPIIMETLGAKLGDAIGESLKMVDESEIYVGIFGHRYGYIPDDPRNPDRLSITEMEYRRAIERGLPVLIFVMDDTHPGPKTAAEGANFYEQTDAGKARLKTFKDELLTKHVVGFFKSPEDLRGLLIQALTDPDVIERAGALAGTTVDDEDEEPETPDSTLPTPPDFYADPHYTLTTTFVGRSKELRRLDAWAKSADPMMLVEAIGGMGKSAVTWHWVHEHALKSGNYDGVMWWSFYESGATMAAFVRHALAYITGQDPDSLKKHGMRANFKQLRIALAKGRYLLVLDGLERVLVAYHRWNAAQMRDDSVEDAESIIKERDIRACTDPRDDEILRGLLGCENTKTLISTRLIPLALEDRTGNRSDGVAHIHLNGLDPDDALALMRHAGVRVENVPQFRLFMKTFGYHSLLVTLVAGRINKPGRRRGDFDAWYAAEGRDIDVTDFDVRQSQTHVLEYAFDGLDDTARHFLSRVAAFGDAVPYDTLEVFNPYVKSPPERVPEPDTWFEEWKRDRADTEEERATYQAQIDEHYAPYNAYLEAQADYENVYLKSPEYRKALSQFDEMLSELEERGLLRWDREKDTYDMHPVVRGTAFAALEGDDKTQTFERIRGHLEAQPAEDIDAAQEVTDLTNTIGVYRALLGAGKWDEAAGFFINRLHDKLHYNIAAYYTVIELLEPLFPDGTDALPRLSDPYQQSSITTTLATMFYLIGRNDEALVLQGLQLKLKLDNDDSGNLGVGLRNYANSLRDDNQLALAERVYQTALRLAEATDNQSEIAGSRLFLLFIYKDTGQWEKADATYATLTEHPPREVFWQSVVEIYYAESLIVRGLDASETLDKAEKLTIQGNNALIYRQIKGLRGEVALKMGDYDAAIRWFEESVQLYRKSGSSFTGWVLGGLARAYALKGDHDRAREIIETNDFDDYDVEIAEVYLTIGDTDKAKDYAIASYKYRWGDGPPYVWKWKLERAKAVLDALGEPYPDMPPFDPAKVGTYPHQDEVEALIEKLEREKRESDEA